MLTRQINKYIKSFAQSAAARSLPVARINARLALYGSRMSMSMLLHKICEENASLFQTKRLALKSLRPKRAHALTMPQSSEKLRIEASKQREEDREKETAT